MISGKTFRKIDNTLYWISTSLLAIGILFLIVFRDILLLGIGSVALIISHWYYIHCGEGWPKQ